MSAAPDPHLMAARLAELRLQRDAMQERCLELAAMNAIVARDLAAERARADALAAELKLVRAPDIPPEPDRPSLPN